VTKLFHDERGGALVTAIMVTGIMLTLGLATLSWADNGFSTSREERVRESSFNLADTVLDSQIYQLGRNWPTSSEPAPSCSQTSQATGCPSQTTIAQSYTSPDYGAGFTWSTVVQDNGGAVQSFYTTAGAAGQPSYDANGDGKLWVRAETTVAGKTRRLLGEVQAREVPLAFPRNAVTAGDFETTNQGNKVIVDTIGTSGQSGDIAVRCADADPTCATYRSGQVSPETTDRGYLGGDAMSPEDLEKLKSRAKADGTYYTSCPANPSGKIVFVASGNCSYNTGSANTAANPGMFVIENGTLALGGNFEFYGLVYAINAQGSTGNVVTLQGTSLLHGAVAVDGAGGVSAGSSKLNLIFDFNVFSQVKGYGTGELTPGTWRELGPN
jgi:Tfp pilus assembly protein PilX